MIRRSERPPHVLRRAVEDDLGFIYGSWKSSTWETIPWNFMTREHFNPYMQRLIGSCLRAGTTLVACDPEEPSTIYGYVNHIGTTINWLYVRQTVRRMGFAEVLAEHVLGAGYRAKPVSTSAWSKHADDWIRHLVKLSYEPHEVISG